MISQWRNQLGIGRREESFLLLELCKRSEAETCSEILLDLWSEIDQFCNTALKGMFIILDVQCF